MAKDKEYTKLIHTSRWLQLRKAKLTKCPLCERCREEGKVTPAAEVHHVRPVQDGLTVKEKERLMYDLHNLRALCHDCHIKTHIEIGRSGKEQAKRKNSEHLKRFVEKFLRNDNKS